MEPIEWLIFGTVFLGGALARHFAHPIAKHAVKAHARASKAGSGFVADWRKLVADARADVDKEARILAHDVEGGFEAAEIVV
jgi:hypothetical protein